MNFFKQKKLLLFFMLAWASFYVPKMNDFASLYSWSQIYTDESGKNLRITLSEDEKYRIWTDLDAISPIMQKLTLFKEDKYFYYHLGFNPIALVRAFTNAYVLKTNKAGASTISMQLARLHFNLKTKSISGKLKQILAALYLEFLYSKKQILEAYLNLAPYGRNIEGVAAASEFYFHKRALDINLSEALLLTQLPQNPSLLKKHKSTSLIGKKLQYKRQKLYQAWIKAQPQDKKLADIISLDQKIDSLKQSKFLAPHFVTDLTLEKRSTKSLVHTTLNLELQQLVERKLKSFIQKRQKLGVKNAAVLLLDYKTMEVKASVGSADFFADSISGQVNGTNAKRSPGSTLKPLLFALAFDQGIVVPQSILYDTPLSFRTPENFDSMFLGPVTVEDALILSRNVPAVELAAKLKQPDVYDFLYSIGVSKMLPKATYGSSIVLGGLELSMQELVELYAMQANRGKFRKIRKLKSDPEMEGIPMISPEASYMVEEILKKHARPGLNINPNFLITSLPTVWKTGTSIGFRDAWAIGYWSKYVVAVWVGNFSGEANPEFVGSKSAGPLFFSIIDALKASNNIDYNIALDTPKGIKQVELCAISGKIPTRHCKQRRKSNYISGVSPIHRCAIHRPLIVREDNGLRACAASGENVVQKVFEFLPSKVLKIYEQAGIKITSAPKYAKECEMQSQKRQGIEPEILSPKIGVSYQARLAEKTATVPLSATTDADVENVYWYLNKSFLGKSNNKTPFLAHIAPGNYLVRVVDDKGRSSHRYLKVSLTQ